jgi:signal transduction histidine kinase
MIRVIQLTLAGSVIAVAALALVSLTRTPEAGVDPGLPGAGVLHVDPGSPAWRSGVRTGDEVLSLVSSDTATGWILVTTDGQARRSVEAHSYVAVHRGFAGWSIIGALTAVAAAVMAYRSLAASAVVLPLAFAVAAEPLFYAGTVLGTMVGGAALFAGGGMAALAFAGPGLSLDPSSRRRRRRAVIGSATIGVALAIAWLLASQVTPILFDPLDALRWPAAFAFSIVGAELVVDRRRVRAAFLGDRGPAFVDLLYVVLVVTVLVGLLTVARVDPIPLVVAGVLATVVYPFWRRTSLTAFDRFITADARREAALRAVEDERGRLAREIHDAPLQDLAGVIHQLEGVPEAAVATSTLRDVSARLRDVASSLHPPILQDLGLAAAIEDLAISLHAAHPGVAVETQIDDLTGDGSPPPDVAIAAYRIVQEAIANALGHAEPRRIAVSGVVAADTVSLEIVDDGQGFDGEHVRAARAAGHFGLDSMRERAEAVRASLKIDSGPTGTTVRLRWQGG